MPSVPSRWLFRPALVLTLAACDAAPPAALESELERDRAVLETLETLGYRGPAIVSHWSTHDDRPVRTGTTLRVPARGVETLRGGEVENPDAMDRLSSLMAAAEEVTDPELLDVAHNTPTSELNGFVSPSRLKGAAPYRSRIDFTNRFYSYDYAEDTWYLVESAEILSAKPVARDSSGGHFHSSPTSWTDRTALSVPLRVGRIVPDQGTMTGGTWQDRWDAPEFSQEVTFEYELREIGGPNDGQVSEFYGQGTYATRNPWLTRLGPNDATYQRDGGTDDHPEDFNDWGDGDLVSRLQAFAAHYNRETSDRTEINDMGLFFGGRFDLRRGGLWAGAHAEHRGTEADIYPVGTLAHAERFTQLVRVHFPSHELEESPLHWHVRGAHSPYNH